MRNEFFAVVMCIVILLAFSNCARGQTQKDLSDKNATETKIDVHKEVLENGMTVLIKPVHTQPIVTIQAWFKAGSIYEGENLGSGLSHFVEHMIFKGTPNLPVGEFAKRIKSAGGDCNAYTSTDRTVFYATVKSDSFDMAIESFADVIKNSNFDPEETTKEQAVIVKELEEDLDDPARQIYEIFRATVYQVHPYRHPVGGYLEQFKKLTRDDLVNYYKKLYVPNNMVLVIVGDLKIKETSEKVKNLFKDFERKPLEMIFIPEEPRQLGKRIVVRRFETKQAKMILGFQTVAISHPDLYALDVAAVLLGSGKSSRLVKTVKDEKGLVYSISASSYTPYYKGTFLVSCELEPEKIHNAQAAILEEFEKLKSAKISDRELSTAKNKVLTEYHLNRQSVEGIANSLGFAEMFIGNLNFDEEYVKNIKKVSAEEISTVAKKYFTDDNLTITILVPNKFRGKLPEEEIKTTEKVEDEEIFYKKLDNGLRLIVKPDKRIPVVSLKAFLLAGVRFEEKENNGISNLTAIMLTKGTKTKTAEQIAETIETLGGSFSSEGGRNTIGLHITILNDYFDTASDLFYDMLSNPSFDPKKLEIAKREVINAIKRELDEPFRTNLNFFNSIFYGNHPYSMNHLGTLETVEKITTEDLFKFHKKYFTTKNLVIAVVGDVNVEVVREKIEKLFRNMPSFDFKEPSLPLVEDIKKYTLEKKTIEGRRLACIIAGFKTVDLKGEDKYALEIIDSALEGLGGRLFENVREQKALAYAVGSFSRPNLNPGYFCMYSINDPAKNEEIIEAMFSEIEKIKKDGLTEEELKRTKASLIGGKIQDLQGLEILARDIALDELYELGYLNHKEYTKKIESVTNDDIIRVANKYFDKDKCVITIAQKE